VGRDFGFACMWVHCVPNGACLGALVVGSGLRCLHPSRVDDQGLVRSGIVYGRAREWWLACMGTLDPCSGSDDVSCLPLQLLVRVHVWLGRCWFPVLRTHFEGSQSTKISPFPPCAAPRGVVVRGGPRSVRRVPLTACSNTFYGESDHDGRSISRMRNTLWV